MDWPEAAARLAASRNYWLGTTMPSGAPHAAPVWGVVTGQALYLYSERRTVKARTPAQVPEVVAALSMPSGRSRRSSGAWPTTRPHSADGPLASAVRVRQSTRHL